MVLMTAPPAYLSPAQGQPDGRSPATLADFVAFEAGVRRRG
jgi:hypothetical protein